jgi:hypothetical protein
MLSQGSSANARRDGRACWWAGDEWDSDASLSLGGTRADSLASSLGGAFFAVQEKRKAACCGQRAGEYPVSLPSALTTGGRIFEHRHYERIGIRIRRTVRHQL